MRRPGLRSRAVQGDDRLRPHQTSDRGDRRKAACPRVFRGRHQRRHSAGATRADYSRTQRRRHRHPGRHRCGRAWARHGADIARAFNYDIPHDTESYVHRIGRTGRAGRSGNALLFVSPRERHLLKAIEKATRQTLSEAELPTVEDVNAQRVAKFSDSITDTLGASGLELFRRLVEDYEREHDVPMADIAAALALQSRDGEAFLMSPEPPPDRRPKQRPDRPAKTTRTAGDGPKKGFATYRIAVGKRHKIGPGAIVGAIANEGGLHRSDFGHISIGPDFSLV